MKYQTVENAKTTMEKLSETEHKNTRPILTAEGLKNLHTKAVELSTKTFKTKEEKEKACRQISAIVTFISDNLHLNTIKEIRNQETTFTMLSEIDNIHLQITETFSNLLRTAVLISLYASNNNFKDYQKQHILLDDFTNRKLFITLQNQLLNSSYFVTSYNAQTLSNFENGQTITQYFINSVILRPLPPSNTTREILESYGVTFFEKEKDDQQKEHNRYLEDREQAYTILSEYGLENLLN
jgi:hypothetical protein